MKRPARPGAGVCHPKKVWAEACKGFDLSNLLIIQHIPVESHRKMLSGSSFDAKHAFLVASDMLSISLTDLFQNIWTVSLDATSIFCTWSGL